MPLHYSRSGPALPDDAAFQLTVYRIMQESLTNVLRYGRSLARVDVSIVVSGETVTIEVLDDGAGVPGQAPDVGGGPHSGSYGTGQGLAGMAERARIYAGTVEAGRTRHGWRVHAVLSWPGDGSTETRTDPYELQGKA